MMLASLVFGLIAQVQASELVHLSVNNLSMDRTSGLLAGVAEARKIEVIQNDFEVHIDPLPDSPFLAEVSLIDDKLMFKNQAIRFAVPLDQGNPLKMLDSISLDQSTVNIDPDLITIDSEKLSFANPNGMKVSMENALLECDPEGKFTTAIDEVCFKKARIRSRDEYKSPTVNMIYEDPISSMKIALREMGLTEEILLADAQLMSGKYKDGNYKLENAKFKCHRELEMFTVTPYDLEKFLQSCLAASEVEVEKLAAKIVSFDTEIVKPRFNITHDKYKLFSKSLSFVSEGQKSTAEELDLNCYKIPLKWDEINHYHVIKGCLKALDAKVKEIVPSSETLVLENDEKIDISEITNIFVTVRNGKMIMTGKLKVWLRLNFKLEASVDLDEEKGELHILLDNTRVADMNAKDLALYMIRKIISGDAIRIDGDNIYIKI